MVIDGRAIAEQINLNTQKRINQLPFRPLLVDVMIGDDPVSLSYVKIKQRTSQKYGLDFELVHLPNTTTTTEAIECIKKQSERDNIAGLIVQIPLPSHISQTEVLNSIPENVDVDLLNDQTNKKFYEGQSRLVPPTAGAIWEVMQTLPENWSEQKILVLGQGNLVGKPVAQLLKQHGLKFDVADEFTVDKLELLQSADLIISGVGKPSLISGEMVKTGCVIIDAGTSESDGSIRGDADFESVSRVAKFITPVPGGIGPVTVAKLLENVVINAEQIFA